MSTKKVTPKKEGDEELGKPKPSVSNWSLEIKQKVVDQENRIKELEEENRRLSQAGGVPQKKVLENTSSPIQAVPPEIATKMAELQGMINVLMSSRSSSMSTTKEMWKITPTPADIQEKYVTFSARSVGYVISSYTKNSVTFIAPFKPIFFQYSGSDIRKNGKADDIINFCTYSTNIVKEIEFIRNHPLYGVAFSENLNETVSADAHLLYRMTAIITRLKNLNADTMLNMARSEKINIHSGLSNEQIVMELASRMVKKEIQMETTRQEEGFQRQMSSLLKG